MWGPVRSMGAGVDPVGDSVDYIRRVRWGGVGLTSLLLLNFLSRLLDPHYSMCTCLS